MVIYIQICIHICVTQQINGEQFSQSYPEKVEDALAACNDIEEKLQSYMAHKVWCTNQNIAIKRIENNIITKLKESNGNHIQSMMIDKRISSRETTLEHYRKRGIGWNGVYLMFYKLKEYIAEDGTKERIPDKHSVYG